MPKIIILSILSLFSIQAFSYSEAVFAEIEEHLKFLDSDIERLNTYYNLSSYYIESDADLAQHYLEKSTDLLLASTTVDDFQLAYYIAKSNQEIRNYDASVSIYNKLLSSGSNHSEVRKVDIFFNLTLCYLKTDRPTEAIAAIQKGRKFELTNLELGIFDYNTGLAERDLGNSEEAMKSFVSALEAIDVFEDETEFMKPKERDLAKETDGNTNFAVSSLFLDLGNISLANKYLTKSVEELEEVAPSENLSAARNNLAMNHILLEDYDNVIETLEADPALPHSQYLSNTYHIALLKSEQTQKAASLLRKSLNTITNKNLKASAFINLAIANQTLGNHKQALSYITNASKLIDDSSSDYIKLAFLKEKARLVNANGDAAQATQLYDKYVILKDSVLKVDRNYAASMSLNSFLEHKEIRDIEKLETLTEFLHAEIENAEGFSFGLTLMTILSVVVGLLLLTREGRNSRKMKTQKSDNTDVTIDAEPVAEVEPVAAPAPIADPTEARLIDEITRLNREIENEKRLGKVRVHYLSLVSHNIKNPLTAMMNCSGLIQESLKIGAVEKATEYTNRIPQQILKIDAIVDDALRFTKCSMAKLRFEPIKLDFVYALKSTIESFQLDGRYQVGIDFTHTKNEIALIYDTIALQNIIDNLISNALKYSKSNSKIDIKLTDTAESVNLCVRDSGIGIPKDQIKDIFNPLKRCSNSDTISGSGLGMFILKQSLDAGGAEIDIQSEQNKGTTINVTFPKSYIYTEKANDSSEKAELNELLGVSI